MLISVIIPLGIDLTLNNNTSYSRFQYRGYWVIKKHAFTALKAFFPWSRFGA